MCNHENFVFSRSVKIKFIAEISHASLWEEIFHIKPSPFIIRQKFSFQHSSKQTTEKYFHVSGEVHFNLHRFNWFIIVLFGQFLLIFLQWRGMPYATRVLGFFLLTFLLQCYVIKFFSLFCFQDTNVGENIFCIIASVFPLPEARHSQEKIWNITDIFFC